MSDGRPTQALLRGLSVLLVEDETLISFLIEDMLQELGCSDVRHASAVGHALSMLAERRPDVAVVDVNLGGSLVYPLVERLDGAGIPFVFATGYGRRGLPQRWSARPVIQKPFARDVLAAALRSALHA